MRLGGAHEWIDLHPKRQIRKGVTRLTAQRCSATQRTAAAPPLPARTSLSSLARKRNLVEAIMWDWLRRKLAKSGPAL